MGVVNVTRGQIGLEDMEVGSGTFQRTTSTGGTQTLTKIGNAQVSVFSVKDYGALGDGSANDTSAFVDALAAALLVNGIVYIPAGIYRYNALPLDITGRVSVVGEGPRQSILKPTNSYAGFAVRVNECWRNDGEGLEPSLGTTIDFSLSKAGVVLRDFSVVADRANAASGIQTYGRVDFLEVSNVHLFYIKGVALELGNSDSGDQKALIRESSFNNVRVHTCGDGVASPAVHLTTGALSGDASNQIDFMDCQVVANHGPLQIENGKTGATGGKTRRVRFANLMLHGRNTETDAKAIDVCQIKGRVQDIKFTLLSTNGSHDVAAVKYACIRCLDDDTATNSPQHVGIYGLSILNCAGDGIVIDQVEGMWMEGFVDPGVISGNELIVANVAQLLPIVYNVFGSTNSRSMSLGAGADVRIRRPFANNFSTTANLADISNLLNDDSGFRFQGLRVWASDNNRDYVWTGTVWIDMTGDRAVDPTYTNITPA